MTRAAKPFLNLFLISGLDGYILAQKQSLSITAGEHGAGHRCLFVFFFCFHNRLSAVSVYMRQQRNNRALQTTEDTRCNSGAAAVTSNACGDEAQQWEVGDRQRPVPACAVTHRVQRSPVEAAASCRVCICNSD